MTTLYKSDNQTDIVACITEGSTIYANATVKTRGGSCDGCNVQIGIALASDFEAGDAGSFADCFKTIDSTTANLDETGSTFVEINGTTYNWTPPLGGGSTGEFVWVTQIGSSGLAGTTFVFAEDFVVEGSAGTWQKQETITYANAGHTVKKTNFNVGDTVHIDGLYRLGVNCGTLTDVPLRLRMFGVTTGSVFDLIPETDYDIVNGSSFDPSDISGGAVSWDSTGRAEDMYELNFTALDPGSRVNTLEDKEYFSLTEARYGLETNMTLYSNDTRTTISSDFTEGATVFANGLIEPIGGTCHGVNVDIGIGYGTAFEPSSDGSIANVFSLLYSTTANLDEGGSTFVEILGSGAEWASPASGSTGELVYVVQVGSSGLLGTTYVKAENFKLDTAAGGIAVTSVSYVPASPSQSDTIAISAVTNIDGDTGVAQFVKGGESFGCVDLTVNGTQLSGNSLPYMHGTFDSGTLYVFASLSGSTGVNEADITITDADDSPEESFYAELRSALRTSADITTYFKDHKITMTRGDVETGDMDPPHIWIVPKSVDTEWNSIAKYKHTINFELWVVEKKWQPYQKDDAQTWAMNIGDIIRDFLKCYDFRTAYQITTNDSAYEVGIYDEELLYMNVLTNQAEVYL